MSNFETDFEKMKRDRAENDFNFQKSDFPVEKSIKKEEPNIIRIFSTQYVKYLRCWALSDPDSKGERKNIPVITYNEVEGTSLFGQMLGDEKNFFKDGIMETVKQGNAAVPKYQSIDPDLINLLFYKNDFSGRTGSWKPRREYIFNIIDRDPEIIEGKKVLWCVENKKTKLLRFIPMAFDNLVACMENEGPDVHNYDINYTIRVVNNRVNHYIQKAGPMLPNVVAGPLTEEELQYQTWDLLDAVRLSSATFCLKWFRQTIQRISEVMQIDWISRFEEQAKLEQEERNANSDDNVIVVIPPHQSNAATSPVTNSGSASIPNPRFMNAPNTVNTFTPEPKPAPQPPVTPQTNVNTSQTIPKPQPSQAIPKSQPVTQQTTAQSHVPPVRNVAIRSAASPETISCGHCHKPVSPADEFCPHCRNQLLAPCEKCGKLFSVFDSVCPHCGAQYLLA